MLELKKRGAVTFEYGNNIRAQAKTAGVHNAFDIPGFVPEYIRPLFCEGRGPFRWAALSGSPGFNNEGDNEITGFHVSNGDAGRGGILGALTPHPFHDGWRVFYTAQHGDNVTWEIIRRPGSDDHDGN